MTVFSKRADLEARLGASTGAERAEPAPVDVANTLDDETAPAVASRPEPVFASQPQARPEAPAEPRVWPEGAGTVLAAGTVFEGTLRAAEPVRIAGTLQGTLEAEGPVVVEEGGRLVARVVAPEVIVAGFIDGRIQCHGRLHVRATGLVKGKLHVGTLRIEEGALLDGQLQMAGAAGAASIAAVEPLSVAEPPRPRKAGRAGDSPPVIERLEACAVNE